MSETRSILVTERSYRGYEIWLVRRAGEPDCDKGTLAEFHRRWRGCDMQGGTSKVRDESVMLAAVIAQTGRQQNLIDGAIESGAKLLAEVNDQERTILGLQDQMACAFKQQGEMRARLTKLESKGKPTATCPKCGKQERGYLRCSDVPCSDCVATRPPAPEGKKFTGEWHVPVPGELYLSNYVLEGPKALSAGKDPSNELDEGGNRWILEDVEPEYPRWFKGRGNVYLWRFDDWISNACIAIVMGKETGERDWANIECLAKETCLTEIAAAEAEKILADAKKPALPKIHDADCCGTCGKWDRYATHDLDHCNARHKSTKPTECCTPPLYERKG